MKLDQLLGTLSTEQLQDLVIVWAPDEPTSNSKLALFRVLRERMNRPAGARHCLELAEPMGRGIVRRLLRSKNVSQSVGVVAASSGARPRSIDETRAVISELAAMGLVCLEPEKRWEEYGSARITIPVELVGPLREATGIDDRPWQEILNLADHLAALSAQDLAERLEKLGLACDDEAPIDSALAQLVEPSSCSDRLASLSRPLRDMVHAAMRTHAGVLPLDSLGELEVEPPDLDRSVLADWRAELEANFVGTVGDVSLLDYGIDLDGTVLAVFTEVIEAWLSAPLERPVAAADPVGPDFLLDLLELVLYARESQARLKASGALTGPASDRIIAGLTRPSLPLMDAYDLLELRVACAEKLGLVERAGDLLAARRAAWEWERQSYEEQAADLFGLVGSAVPTARSKHHHDGLCEIASGLLRSMTPGEWRRSRSLAHTAVRRYLAALESSGLHERILDAVHRVSEYVLPPFPGVKALCGDVHEAVTLEAYATGILDLATEGAESVAERLSEFGAVATGQGPTRAAPPKLIATPDFEVVILPEGDTTRLRYELGQFAAPGKFEQTYHLKITKERVERAVARGLSADRMIKTLREHCDTDVVPQNVEYSIRGWAGRVRVATVEDVCVFELPDEEMLKVVGELPEMKDLIIRQISPTALALSRWPGDRKLLAALRELGVHVR